MTISKRVPPLSRIVAALAAVTAFGPALAQEGGAIAPAFTAPDNSVSVGAGFASGDQRDRARFGLFNGLRNDDVNGLFGFNYSNREAATGRWLTIQGNNLGLDNRDLGVSYRWLGDLKVNVDYSEMVRHDPRTINTSLQGAGTTNPVVPAGLIAPGAGQDLNLELKRKSLGLIVEKQFGPYQVEINFKTEDKNGARYFGKGFACSTSWGQAFPATGCNPTVATPAVFQQWALLMLPEPVNSTIRQLDAKLNYSGEKLKLSGGYYGSFYTNDNGNISPTIGLAAFGNQGGGTGTNATNAGFLNVMSQPVALWPDNQSHQLFLAGNYAFTPTTRANFKYSYTRATQHESFTGMGLTTGPGGRDNLDGRIDWTKFQLGLSAHPLHDLHVHGDIGYDHKANKTPLDLYNQTYACNPPNIVINRQCRNAANTANVNVTPSSFYTNGNQSPTKYDAKIEASYRLPQNFLLVGGLKYEHEDFGAFTPTDVAGGVSGIKQKLDETSYRVELRKTMSETFTGSVSYISARKRGLSSWLLPADITATNTTGATPVSDAQIFNRTAIFPFIYMDRNRDKFRVMGNWTPMEALSLTLFWDDGKDTYHAPTEHGLRSSKMGNLSLDASYALSENWKLSAFASRGEQKVNSGHSTGYDADLKDTASSFGLGFSGTPVANLRIGGDFTWIHDRLDYQQTPDPSAAAAAFTYINSSGGLPDVLYKLTRLKLYGEYTMNKNSMIRADFIHNRTFFNEWTYNFNGTPWTYSDNTTVNAQQNQVVNFIGLSYIYKFQ